MTSKTTKGTGAAKSRKAAITRGESRSRAANIEVNANGERASRTGAGSTKRKEPFVL